MSFNPFTGSSSSNLTQIMNVLQNCVTAIATLTSTIAKIFPLGLSSSAAWTPGTIAAGAQTQTTVACASAVLGMSAQAAFSLNINGLTLTAYVSAANAVTVVLGNLTGTSVSIGSGIISVWTRSN